MFIQATQPIINQTLNFLKQRIGFMAVFAELSKYPEEAAQINDALVHLIGDYLASKVSDYQPNIGSDVGEIIFNYLETHPRFMGMFKSVKPHILEQMAAEISDMINTLLKDPGPTK